MGVKGLLKKVPCRTVDVAAYRGERVAIDANGWLYKAVKNPHCARRLALGQDVTGNLVGFARGRLAMLKDKGVIPGMSRVGPPHPPPTLFWTVCRPILGREGP